MYATQGDSVPFEQGQEMLDAFDIYQPTADVVFYKINNGSLHAFKYWNQINELTQECVSAEVIDFLQMHL
ncbi:MAG: hypothetical protein M3Q46_11590 [Verrucomicrobiota bacterium]|nr:hypothetical protein [Verrucomicrobiota bacterium]